MKGLDKDTVMVVVMCVMWCCVYKCMCGAPESLSLPAARDASVMLTSSTDWITAGVNSTIQPGQGDKPTASGLM